MAQGSIKNTVTFNNNPTGAASGDLSGSYPSPSVVKINGNSVASTVLGSIQDGYVLTWVNGSSNWSAKPATTQFVAGGDLSGTSSSQTVISISGSSPIAITPSILQFTTSTTSPTLNQANNTANSSTGQTLTVQAQNATGTSSTGGQLVLASGTGTSSDGYVLFKSGAATIATITSNQFISNKGIRKNVTAITGAYQVLNTDENIIVITNTSAFTVTMPASPMTGDFYIIKDASGSAATYNITISGNSNNIDGSADFIININYASVALIYNGTSWSIL